MDIEPEEIIIYPDLDLSINMGKILSSRIKMCTWKGRIMGSYKLS